MLRGFPVISFPLFISIFLSTASPSIAQRSVSAKNIEKNMARVNDSLYACRYEVSNGEYNVFLKEVASKDSILYPRYRSDSSKWNDVFRLGDPPMAGLYHRHPAFADYPVVNISYEAAKAFCAWLTEKYNADKKRKFQKVVFVLPAEVEWVTAAQGRHADWQYPWGRYGMVNKRGYFMCNFKPVGDPYYVRDSLGNPKIVNYEGYASLQDARFPDDKGSFYTTKVKSFSPNGFGLYSVSGNVAEMIAVPGFAMGGSWNSYGGEVTPTSGKQYKYPSPEVGFRVFMKIIEP